METAEEQQQHRSRICYFWCSVSYKIPRFVAFDSLGGLSDLAKEPPKRMSALSYALLVSTAAFQRAPLLGRDVGVPVVRSLPLRARLLTCAESDRGEPAGADDSEAAEGARAGESLEAQFARIARERAAGTQTPPPSPVREPLPPPTPAGQPEKFDGIREIILVDGKPVSVPKRVAPEVSLEGQLRERISVTGILFGSVLTLISIAFFFAIAGADNAALQPIQ